MARRRSSISRTRSWLYWWAKILGDVSAVSKGPEAVVKRMARKQAWRTSGRWLNQLFR